ncbi:ankyrin repeat domain-containing protein [Achromobacter sp. MY14]|uniref:ankyrin repeat domain-containing protein n=1 Tax=unclassified Achromobacter TaxID=2626865 RepID=UPI001E2A52DB|nr:ankyrin repeat domain-containing protein [Achromobacter sp. MY14]MCD0496768.1 ankyrin repeat domain-containing protein [Achromobacter sp. MY14]
MTMTPEQIKAKQQSMLMSVNGTTSALPPTGNIQIDIWTAVKQNNYQATDEIYKSNPRDYQPQSGLLLGVAALLGHTETVKVLVENGANPDNGLTQAAESGHIQTTSYLLEKGAKNIQDALTKAIEKENVEMFNHLISKGADFEYNHCEPLRWAAMSNARQITHTILLDHRADPTPTAVDWLKENGHTYPLEVLAKRNLNDKLQTNLNTPKPKATKSKIKGFGMKI